MYFAAMSGALGVTALSMVLYAIFPAERHWVRLVVFSCAVATAIAALVTFPTPGTEGIGLRVPQSKPDWLWSLFTFGPFWFAVLVFFVGRNLLGGASNVAPLVILATLCSAMMLVNIAWLRSVINAIYN